MANNNPAEPVPVNKGNGAPEPKTHLPNPVRRPPGPPPTSGPKGK